MDGTGLNNRARNGDSLLRSTTWGTRLACLALVTMLAAALALADGNHHKLSKELEALRGGDGATVDVIIQFNQTPTAAHHQKVQSRGGVLKLSLIHI